MLPIVMGRYVAGNAGTVAKRRKWLKPATTSWAIPSVDRGCPKSRGWLAVLIIFLLLLAGAPAGLTAYGYTQLQVGFQIEQCSPEIVLTAKPGVSAINRIKGLNVEGHVVFTNPSFIPLYVPPMNYEFAIEGRKCPPVIKTKAAGVAPSSSVSQSISLQIGSDDLPQLVLHPLAKGGTIHIGIVSKLPLGGYSLTRATQVETSITKPLSSYIR